MRRGRQPHYGQRRRHYWLVRGFIKTGEHVPGSYQYRAGTPPASGSVALEVDFDAANNSRRLMVYARVLETYGHQLAELIYSPLGHSWQSGRERYRWAKNLIYGERFAACELGVADGEVGQRSRLFGLLETPGRADSMQVRSAERERAAVLPQVA